MTDSKSKLRLFRTDTAISSLRLLDELKEPKGECLPWHQSAATEQADANGTLAFALIANPHCAFEKMVEFTELLKGLTLDKARGCIVFVSEHFHTHTPELDRATSDTKELLEHMRFSQFYIRMFESYGWSTFCHISRLKALYHRIQEHPQHYLSLTNESLAGWKSDVERIEKVICKRLELGVWANTTLPDATERSGQMAWSDRRGRNRSQKTYPDLGKNILKAMALVHQFGRLDTTSSEELIIKSGIRWMAAELSKKSPDAAFSPPHQRNLLQESTVQSRNLWECATPQERKWDNALRSRYIYNARFRNIVRANLFVFDLLRDASQMLSKGTSPWAAAYRWPGKEQEHGNEQKPVRVLAIKDHIRGESEHKFVEEMFHEAFDAAFRTGEVVPHCINDTAGKNQDWDTHEWWLERINGKPVEVRGRNGTPTMEPLLEYDIILIEAEFSNRFVGPSIIQWLDHMLDEVQEGAGKERARRPQVFVLSRDDNAGHSYMCLWLGAQAFASKSRLFGIPPLLTMANLRGQSIGPDKKRLRPNFYALEGLLPHQRNRLQSIQIKDRVLGDAWDKAWVQSLPKADLHYHIGTSISLDAVRALALNTAGYVLEATDDVRKAAGDVLEAADDESKGFDRSRRSAVKDVIRKACQIALLYSLERQESSLAKGLDPVQHLWGVARYILLPTDANGRVVSKKAADSGALDTVVQWLVRHDRPVRQHEACAILVSAIAVFECLKDGKFDEPEFSRLYAQWMGLEAAAGCLHSPGKGSLAGNIGVTLSYLLQRIASNWKDAFSERPNLENTSGTSDEFVSQLASDAIKRSARVFKEFKDTFLELMDAGKSHWLHQVQKRFEESGAPPVYGHDKELVDGLLEQPREMLKRLQGEDRISLDRLVHLPAGDGQVSGLDGKSLKRYLVGCDLLGAEHLQFPENILLAACDITRQNVEDNVVYSELRCATTGYCRGGMNVIDATDLLCAGFDLGALLFGQPKTGKRAVSGDRIQKVLDKVLRPDVWESAKAAAESIWNKPERRWVRSNILLGAKRHKAGDIDDVVPLVVHYLARGPEVEEFRSVLPESLKPESLKPEPGRWWHRCQVAGFDLSGNEASQLASLQESIQPLFAACAPITIHAGEAMSAHSIWEAVHKLGAQRIGHGLRLRDDTRLLEHCVRNNICMELCPISNSFTNSFEYPPLRSSDASEGDSRVTKSQSRVKSQGRERYPILDFFIAGLDVCVNTDNRSIHRDRSTLSDEFLEAARLCGGLSKWEVLRLCKAGFKNAFLAKDDVAALLRHVEYEIYKIASEHSGENQFPDVERFMPKPKPATS